MGKARLELSDLAAYVQPTVDKPARGFYWEIQDNTGTPYDSGYATASGASAGCTDVVNVPYTQTYKLYVESRASISSNTIYAYDADDGSPLVATYTGSTWTALTNTTRYPVLPGSTESR